MLTLTAVNKTFFPGTSNERRALRDIDLHLAPRDFVTVIGSNGAGKSTLLNIVAGSITADSGSVVVHGVDVTRDPTHARAARIARVFQDPKAGTSPHLTIEQNLAIALTRGHRRGLRLAVPHSRRQHFRDVLAQLGLGLEDRLTTHVGLLSGGQRQALSLLMASFTHPDILLLDEHTAALDPERAELVSTLTATVVEQNELTALMVTHNMEQALSLGNRLLMMHDGAIIAELDARAKAKAKVTDLLEMFANNRGATLADRTLLS